MQDDVYLKEEAKLIAAEKLKRMLRKLGLHSVKSTMFDSVLTVAEVEAMVNRVQNNFGAPDVLIMDDSTFEAYKKIFK